MHTLNVPHCWVQFTVRPSFSFSLPYLNIQLIMSRHGLYILSVHWNVLFYLFIRVGNGSWAFDGLKMVSSTTEDGMTTVNCTSTHLSSFAVLVDVSGVLSNDVS